MFNFLTKHIMSDSKNNTGSDNSGDGNSGDGNSGDGNSGYWNSGDGNSGYWNSGDRNSGDGNSGDRNSGYWNSGDRNSGYRNSGYRNSGDGNSGDGNSGDWNSGYRNSGIFNTDEPYMRSFNKETKIKLSDFINSDACPDWSGFDLNTWISESMMTEEEREENPSYKTTGGYLKTLKYKEAWAVFWRKASEENRQKFLNLPNFCPKIFEEITGIDVSKGSSEDKKKLLDKADELIAKAEELKTQAENL